VAIPTITARPSGILLKRGAFDNSFHFSHNLRASCVMSMWIDVVVFSVLFFSVLKPRCYLSVHTDL